MATSDVQAINLEQASYQIRQALVNTRAEMMRAANPDTGPYSGAGVTVRDAPGRAGDIIKAWRRGLAAVRGDTFASHNVIAAAERVLKDDALLYLADLERNFNRALEAYRAGLVDPLPALPAADAERIWRRVRDQLDAGVNLGTVLADADVDTVRVMLEEITAYARVKYPDDAQAAKFVADGHIAQIAQRLYDLASPEQRRRLDLAKKSDQGAAWVQTTFGRARYAVENNDASAPGGTMLVTWEGAVFNV